MKKIGLLVSSEKVLQRLAGENSPLVTKGGVTTFSYGGAEVYARIIGKGKVEAAIAAYHLLATCKPEVLISVGAGASLKADIRPLDTIVGTYVKYCDVYCGKDYSRGQFPDHPDEYPCLDLDLYGGFSETIREFSAKKSLFGIYTSPVVSCDWYMETMADRMKALRSCGRAKIVDMESGGIAQICHMFSLPYLPICVVTHVAGEPPRRKSQINFDEQLVERPLAVCRNILNKLTNQ